ncbi:hypothetical protein ElyMa_004694600 [Elysia marginata]|uniref:Secreted protein n=1 Tax=Elysia marginata TaxID=1093978 RepID=A0AAV4I679_9GAST|nr:hypothetical protein ElyMa_004694600 [Elysia marginata]
MMMMLVVVMVVVVVVVLGVVIVVEVVFIFSEGNRESHVVLLSKRVPHCKVHRILIWRFGGQSSLAMKSTP